MSILQKLEKHKRKCVIIRHGQTRLNVSDKIRGWSDIGLDETGFEQAEKLGRKLKNSGIDMLIASDLTRTLQTAACISKESGIPLLATTLALRPWNVGDYTAKPGKEVHPIMMDFAENKPDENIPNGESFNSFKYRVIMGVIAFLNEYEGKTIGFVAHHRNDRILRGWYEAGCPDDLEIDFEHFSQFGIEPGTYDILEIESDYLK